ncbi:hypothetical protein F0562_009938 [Nyssa sinensis]|uniref:NB-ARC domain-containing protein n=1 Tax=Nyssa sinensis TaxID=561372 RepID=A0A5J4ZXH7_9ASTE|nr:hypothetical protein F0562_009938 [Nyssa sinensis]
MMLKAYLKDMEGNEGSEVLKDKVIQVQQVAYDIEDALEESMLHVTHRFHRHKISRRAHELVHAVTLRIPLHSMSSKVKVIKSKIENITIFDSFCDGRTSNSTIVEKGLQESPRALDDDEMVGFENPKERLIHQLITKGESRDTTISVVGPCGSGKTILVKNVYECKKVKEWFDCHAWVHVSRSCKIEELLGNMLKQFCISRKEQIPHDHEAADTKAKLRYYLQKKRLFQPTMENVLQELEDWSQKIVKRCQGWPLAIVAVSSLLARRKQFPIEWKKMHDSLVSEIGTTSANLSIIRKLLPSYKDLPSNLRTCFLYFSIFPKDYSIKRGRLIRLWVAEGFVMKARNKTMEDVAEDYLNELIGRNLVQVNSKDVDGRVMSCRVLNLVHEFIILKSEEVNFASIFTEANTSSSHEKIRRLSIHNSCTALSLSRPSFNCVRSAFLFRRDKFSPSEIGNVLCDFKLLRVLDLQDAAFDKFPQDIFRLTLLRYLSLRSANIKMVQSL